MSPFLLFLLPDLCILLVHEQPETRAPVGQPHALGWIFNNTEYSPVGRLGTQTQRTPTTSVLNSETATMGQSPPLSTPHEWPRWQGTGHWRVVRTQERAGGSSMVITHQIAAVVTVMAGNSVPWKKNGLFKKRC
jgi:hypothetical protein